MMCKKRPEILQNGKLTYPENMAVISSGYAIPGQAGMSGIETGRRSASLRREKACYRKKATSFPKRNRKQNL